jgi:putative hydrolase of the HAD superfamily
MVLLSPRIRVIFFDAVGTLIHPEPSAAQVYADIGLRFGSKLAEPVIRIRFQAAFSRQEAMDRANGWHTDETREYQRWQQIVKEVLIDVADPDSCFQELYKHFADPRSWQCDAHAEGVLHGLAQRGYPLGMASNFDHRLRGIAISFKPLGLLNYLVISSDVGWRKPAAAFFHHVCDVVNVRPDEILFVGDDATNDCEGAMAAGMQVIQMASPKQIADVAQHHRKPWTSISSLAELLDLVK